MTKNRKLSAASLAAVENFDNLADSVLVDLAAVRSIACVSRPTIYRWISRGLLPQPRKVGPLKNFWTAGEIRAALAGGAAA